MKKYIYFILTLVTLQVTLLKSQSVSYTYVRNNPYNYKNFSLSIDPLFIDVNGHNGYAYGWGLRAEHMLGKRLLANFDMRTGFGTNLYRKSNKNTRNYFNMEGGLGLIFFNKVRERNVPIILSSSSSSNGRTTTTTTTKIRGGVPAKCWFIVALRGGFQQYTNTLDYKNLADTLLTFNGQKYKDSKNDFTFKDTLTNKAIDQVGGIALTSVYGGIQFRRIRDLLIDVDGWGYRSNIKYSDFYIDVIFAPVIGIKNFTSNGKEVDVKYEKVSHFGWRAGWFIRQPKEQGFSVKLEFGSRPGFKAPTNTNVPLNMKNMYCMLTYGLYIPLKLKPIYQGD